MRVQTPNFSNRARAAAAVSALVLCLSVFTPFAPRAQRTKEQGVNVTGVSSRTDARGAVVTVTGDGALSRAQTWQDDEGFHVVGYRWEMKAGAPRGVKVRKVGDSLELIVPVKRGGSVTVQPRFNTLELVVSGGLAQSSDAEAAQRETAHGRARAENSAGEAAPRAGNSAGARSRAEADSRVRAIERRLLSQQEQEASTGVTTAKSEAREAKAKPAETQAKSEEAKAKPEEEKAAEPQPETFIAGQFHEAAPQATPAVTEVASAATPTPAPEQPAATPAQARATMTAGPAVGSRLLVAALVAFLLAVSGTLVFVRQRGRGEAGSDGDAKTSESQALVKATNTKPAVAGANGKAAAAKDSAAKKGAGQSASQPGASQPGGAAQSGAGAALVKSETAPAFAPSISLPPVLFGAFRVEQEVEKMTQGHVHSVDVLASRAQDDRRALETSLLKMIGREGLEEGERARLRAALEDYGFVARQSAALLLAPDSFTRSSAARTLGQIRSASSLPFLLEALYDADAVVRTEAVTSLGALGLPSAIGALLDMARRHPELPPQLLGRALSACSVDSIEMSGDGEGGYALAGRDLFTGEITSFEPVAEIEQLPMWLEDETLAEALERLDSTDVEARVAAAHQLAQYSVQRSVEALSSMAARDRSPAVRAAAVTGLGLIGHESVFAPVVIAMADEAREVRAAAARALSRLSFDRADAYVRVIETADDETMARLAGACVTAGLARQALDRLGSEDRRQAYEAFSLLSLVARGGQSGVILEVVAGGGDLKARLSAARLLALQGRADVAARLREIAAQGDAPEELRAAICEVVVRGEQADAPVGAAGE